MPNHLSIEYQVLHRDELTGPELLDVETATIARLNAYSPYSKFQVGVAIRTNDNIVFEGWNVENISYNVLHAESNAIGRITAESRAQGLKNITVVGGPEKTDSENIVSPCGDCRQKLFEFLRPQDNPTIIMAGVRGKVIRIALRDLLPFGFSPESLK